MSDEPVVQIPVTPIGAGKRKPPALGRGLGALLGETRREEPLVSVSGPSAVAASEPGIGLAVVPVASIQPDPRQPRRHFDEVALDELAASIASRGVIQPVIVRPLGAGQYQLVAGERRWRAAQKAQVHEIPALIRDLDARDVMALALIENLQREDLNPIEEARAYQRLSEEEGLTQAEISRFVDKSRSHVANLMRLLALPEEVIAMVERGELTMGHARALIGCPNAYAIAADAVSRQLSVREVERIARHAMRGDDKPEPRKRAARDAADSADIAAVQGYLEDLLGLPVKIKADADPRSGSVSISYRSLDQLDLICQRLTGGSI